VDFIKFIEKFNSEQDVIDYFINIRYNGKIVCPHCKSINEGIYYKRTQPRLFHCKKCNNTFSIFTGTIFEKSSTDLRKWMYAIHLVLNSKKGISGYQLKREIDVTYKTAWRMLKLIRESMKDNLAKDLFSSIIEMDETYVGGKPRKEKSEIKNKRGRGTKKTPVIGMIDRNSKKVKAQVAEKNKDGKKLSGKQLMKIIEDNLLPNSTIITDEFSGYNRLNRSNKYSHHVIDHSKDYCIGNIHTNNIESFWATLKRGIYGIYHHISVKYMDKYLNEFTFRYNNRDRKDIFDLLVKQTILAGE
jgi:transposase-like protein